MAKSQAPDSSPYQVVARRFRPTRFEQVVGQEAVVEPLRTALASGQIPHAFLFSGSRGVGKTTMARILARCLNCETGPTAEPCDQCAACTSILAGNNPDFVEIDAASHNLVDDIRELRDRVGLSSMGSRYKVYLLDEVHMLTRSAFNAFLKTLEEPPPNVAFILATTELHKVPETIRSRCQVYLFRRMDDSDIASRLTAICQQESIEIPDEVLADIASASHGGMRDAEGALERLVQVAREHDGALDVETYRRIAHRIGFETVVEAVEALLAGDASAALQFAAKVTENGADEREALGELLEVERAILMLSVDGPETTLVGHQGSARERLAALATGADVDRLEAMIQAGLQGREKLRRLEDRRLVFELAILAMARAGSLPQLSELLAAVRSGAGIAAPAGAAGGATVPAAASAAPAAGGNDLKSKLMEYLAREAPLLGRTIDQCQVSQPGEGRVHIVLRTDRRLHRDRLNSDGVQADLKTGLKEIFGRDVSLSIDVGGGAAAPAAAASEAAPKPRGDKPKPGASVQKVVERFDGQILDDDDASLK